MKARTCAIAWCALVLVGALNAATAAATPLDKRTTFTFTTPFSIPGVTLPAGSYLFRLADDTRGRDVIQVLSADGKTPYAMFFSLRTLRGEPVDTPELRFMETAADVPVAIKSWWYAGDRQGYEFVYPRAQARLLAEGAGTPVLTTEAAPIEAKPEFEYITPETAAAPAAERPVLIGEVAAAEEVEPALAQAPPATLPKTGSPTATLLLLGALALLSAGAVRAARRAQA